MAKSHLCSNCLSEVNLGDHECKYCRVELTDETTSELELSGFSVDKDFVTLLVNSKPIKFLMGPIEGKTLSAEDVQSYLQEMMDKKGVLKTVGYIKKNFKRAKKGS